MTKLTKDSEALMRSFLDDAGNWDGSPMLDINDSERGNLTDLKKKGLLTTMRDEENSDVIWVVFTNKGLDYAVRELGYHKSYLNLY